MQISPTTVLTQQLGAQTGTAPSATDFENVFSQLQTVASEPDPAPEEQAYGNNTLLNFSEIPVTENDFAAVSNVLKKTGTNSNLIQELEEKVEDGALGWGDLLATLENAAAQQNIPVPLELSANGKTQLSSFLQQTGINPKEAADIIAQVESGSPSTAWEKISAALQGLDATTELSLTQEELSALGTSLQLDADTMAKLKGLLSSSQDALSQQDINDLTALIDSSITSASSAQKAVDELKQILNPILAGITDQNQEASADIHATNEENAQEILRTDQATEKGLGFMRSVNSKDASTTKASSAENQSTPQQQTASTTETAEAVVANDTEQEQQTPFEDQQENDASNGWSQLFTKLAFADTSSASQSITSNLSSFTTQVADVRPAATSFLDQIQSGIFKAMQNGTNQLSLKINPSDLGQLTVLVSVKNNEVTANIKADTPEAAKAVHENIHTLRASLEAQGLKVEKLDVQTSTQNHLNDKGWSNTDQHNAQQEAQQRFFNKQHLRQLKNTQQDLVSGAITQAAASIRQQGVYVVA